MFTWIEKKLSGYKTYLSAAMGVVATGALAMGYIDEKTFAMIATVAGFLGLGFARAGMKKKDG
jgi:hypothetical protein